jgi:hypothetical protein
MDPARSRERSVEVPGPVLLLSGCSRPGDGDLLKGL